MSESGDSSILREVWFLFQGTGGRPPFHNDPQLESILEEVGQYRNAAREYRREGNGKVYLVLKKGPTGGILTANNRDGLEAYRDSFFQGEEYRELTARETGAGVAAYKHYK